MVRHVHEISRESIPNVEESPRHIIREVFAKIYREFQEFDEGKVTSYAAPTAGPNPLDNYRRRN
jgi:hypothetical protein